jgi:hypothetical protein
MSGSVPGALSSPLHGFVAVATAIPARNPPRLVFARAAPSIGQWRRSGQHSTKSALSCTVCCLFGIALMPRDLQKNQGLRRFLSKNLPSCLSFRPSSVLRQQLHSSTMRLLSRLEADRKSCAIWYVLFRQSPNVKVAYATHEPLFSPCGRRAGGRGEGHGPGARLQHF